MKTILETGKGAGFKSAPVRFIACPPILDAYDFGQFRTIVDVEGGHGLVLATILARYPSMRGILFDRPPVVAEAPQFLEERGVGSRVQLAGGNVLRGVPSDADAYLLRNVLREWPDYEAEIILTRVAMAMPDQARCLLVEQLAPEGSPQGDGSRSISEHEFLLACAGLKMTHVAWSVGGTSIIEAMKA